MVVLVSAHLKCSVGLDRYNIAILSRIRNAVTSWEGEALVGAAFNNTPKE